MIVVELITGKVSLFDGSGINVILMPKKKTTGKKLRTQGNHRENKGNFILIGVWQP